MEQLVTVIAQRDPLLANAVSQMARYVLDPYPSAYPSKEQTEAVKAYLQSVGAEGEGTRSET